jgi:hypothetical protein
MTRHPIRQVEVAHLQDLILLPPKINELRIDREGEIRTYFMVFSQPDETKTYRKHTCMRKEGYCSIRVFDESLRSVGRWSRKGFDHVIQQ